MASDEVLWYGKADGRTLIHGQGNIKRTGSDYNTSRSLFRPLGRVEPKDPHDQGEHGENRIRGKPPIRVLPLAAGRPDPGSRRMSMHHTGHTTAPL